MLYNLHSFALNVISLLFFFFFYSFIFIFFFSKQIYVQSNPNLEMCLRIYSAGKPQCVIEKVRFDSSLT